MIIEFKDGKKKEFPFQITAYEVLKSLSSSLAKEAVAVYVNSEMKDLSYQITDDCKLIAITKDMKEALDILHHSAAHLMAQAISHIYPDASFAYGPATEEGFYYDLKTSSTISIEDFPKIEKEMQKIVNENLPIERREITISEGREIFKNQKYKLIHMEELNDENKKLSAYFQGDFSDLCLGPHVKSTGVIKAFKLLSISSCYFKGDKNNDSLTRIYGTAFFKKEDLDNYLRILEERKECDHKKIGKNMNLFMLSDYGPGFPFWLPNGMILRKELENYWINLHLKNDYMIIKSPTILSRELWETSGHWSHYKENMYITKIDKQPFAIKPMNCPGAILVYANDLHSYKELPLRYAELGDVHRHEASGALNGLFRVRAFTQDDAHILLREDQIGEEIRRLLKIYNEVYSRFNLSYHIELSTRPLDKFVGKISTWNKAEKELEECLKDNHIPYKINPGDGAFYGPKLDFKFKDSLNRIWQCGTIQLDMQLPHRFKLSYVDKEGKKREPIMIHRAIFGSIERFVGVITEHFKGAFPTWLAPEQCRIIPVSTDDEKQLKYAEKLNKKLENLHIRSKVDYRNEKLPYRMRESLTKKVSYSVVIGNSEVESSTVTYRILGQKKTETLSFTDFVNKIKKDIQKKEVTRTYQDKNLME